MKKARKATFSERFNELLREKQVDQTHQSAADALDEHLRPARTHGAMPLTWQEVARWRNGAVPKPTILAAMAGYFGVSIEYLRGGFEAKKSDLGDALAEYVAEQLAANPVHGRPLVSPVTGKPWGRGVVRTAYLADPVRLLRFVVAAARAAEQNDREIERGESSTLFLYTALEAAADELKKAGAAGAAAEAKRVIKTLDRAMAEQLTPRLLSLFDGDAKAPIPAFRLEVAKPA